MIIPSIGSYTSAPAAFGAHETHAGYNEEGYSNPSYGDYGFDSYLFDHSYAGIGNSDWTDKGDYGTERYRTDKDDEFQLIGNNLEINFSSCSGQTADESPLPSPVKDHKGKTPASPSNIFSCEKLDRKALKRMRNRVSASRCRVRKKEWINELQDESNKLSNENKMLLQRISSLEESIAVLTKQ
jgi:bZIP transcription factor